MIAIDWRDLAERRGTITWDKHGHGERGGPQIARDALSLIIGDDVFRAAVDGYVSGQPGFEIARSALLQPGPPAAMERCREIFHGAADAQAAATATNLLNIVADGRVFDWLAQLLASDNVGARMRVFAIVDQLVSMRDDMDIEKVVALTGQGLADPDERVQSRAREVLGMIEQKQRDKTDRADNA